MEKIKILAVQIGSEIGEKEKNYKKVLKVLDENFVSGTDVIILPEVWNVGWECSLFKTMAEEKEDSKTIKFLSELAVEYNANILGGSLPLIDNGVYHNTCPVLNRHGELICTYNKNHLFSYYGCGEGSYVKNGKNPVMVDIDGTKIGLTICYDIRFPEIYRSYRKAGADILVNMAAWPFSRSIHWDSLTRARAVENQCFMVALTQTGILKDGSRNYGHSLIYDYSGNILSEITEKEGAVFAEIDFSEMYDFREKCKVINDIHEKYEVIIK
ncbi:hypothetical protein IJI31_02110 [bacterium]|nr:hypothetical protein [bacterium]